MKRWTSVCACVILLLAVSVPAWAQGGGASSTGSITGEVVDDSGAVLPGVTVTATSPALLGQQVAISSPEGHYRFPSVPPGEYKISFELPGFTTVVREGIRVGLGFTATVNVKLGVATLQETVTVSGESPTIDTSATRVQTNYTQEQLASIPNGRDMWSLLATAPSVTLNRFDVGGSTVGTQTTYFAYGYSGQNRPLIEGINTTEGTAAAGFYLDYGSFEEVFIGAAGNSAEMPNPGVMTQFVSKSGGNRFTPGAYFDYENDKIQGRNLTAEQIKPYTSINPDGNRLYRYKNVNLSLGGPAIKDKIWFFGAFMRQQNEVLQPPSGVIEDGTVFLTRLLNYTGKGTYQLNSNNKLVGYYQWGKKTQPYRTDSAVVGTPIHVTSASTLEQNSPSWVFKGEYNRTFGQGAFLEARAGQFGYDWGMQNHTQANRYEDLGTNKVTGGGRDWLLKRRRNQYTASYSLFKDNWLDGSHTFKFGGEFLQETGNTTWNSGYANQVVHILTNNQPTAVRLWSTPSSSLNGLYTYSAFVTDSWAIDRLTLNIGARLDRYRVYLPAQSHATGRFTTTAVDYAAIPDVAVFNHVVPRLGAIYALSGNGKTVLKANFGRFYFNPGVNLADSVNPNTSDQWAQYTWTDRNGDLVYQPGEEVTLTTRQGGTQNAFIDPNLKNPYTHEASGFVEHALLKDLGVRVGFVWKKDNNGYQRNNVLRPISAYNVPVTRIDPLNGNALALYNLDDTTRGTRNVTINVPGYEGTYKTFEVSANKRYANRWSLVASYSYVFTHEFGSTYQGNRFGQAGAGNALFGNYPLNPNDKTENDFTNWNAKLHGTFDAGWGIHVTPVLKAQSGTPYGRYVNVSGLNYGAQAYLVEPIGTRRQENVVLFDVRAEKQLFLRKNNAKLGLFLDLFNVMNANTATNIIWLGGTAGATAAASSVNASFGRATTVLPPRIAKFGVKFDW